MIFLALALNGPYRVTNQGDFDAVLTDAWTGEMVLVRGAGKQEELARSR